MIPHSRAVHRRERNRQGQIHLWVIEEKVGEVWVRVRVHRAQDGPKASKGQRVRRLRGKELQYVMDAERKVPMSDTEIEGVLGW